jgi:DNA-binding beta-propeller fold protein YncE
MPASRFQLPRIALLAVTVSLASLGMGTPASSAAPRSGEQLWVSRLDGPAHLDDLAYDLVVSPDGSRVFVTGLGRTEQDSVSVTAAYDAATGERLWLRAQAGSSFDIDVSPDGTRVFITGYDEPALAYQTVAFDASGGATLWTALYDGGSTDEAFSLDVSPDGTAVFVTGYSYRPGHDYDYATAAYDAATGAELWSRRYNGPRNRFDAGVDVEIAPLSETVFVTGHSTGLGTGPDWVTIAYEALTGARRWISRYRGPGNTEDFAYHLKVSPDGAHVYVTGTSNFAYTIVAYDAASGAREWASQYLGGYRPAGFDVSPDGSKLFVSGDSLSSEPNYATVAFDADSGQQLWASIYGPGAGQDRAFSLQVAPDGATVFVTGQSALALTGPYDYATVAYDAASGAELWAARYDGPAQESDIANALDLSPDGQRVYVTGKSIGDGTGYDYATVAYSSS